MCESHHSDIDAAISLQCPTVAQNSEYLWKVYILTLGCKNEIWELNYKELSFSVLKPGELQNGYLIYSVGVRPSYIWLKDTTILWFGVVVEI